MEAMKIWERVQCWLAGLDNLTVLWIGDSAQEYYRREDRSQGALRELVDPTLDRTSRLLRCEGWYWSRRAHAQDTLVLVWEYPVETALLAFLTRIEEKGADLLCVRLGEHPSKTLENLVKNSGPKRYFRALWESFLNERDSRQVWSQEGLKVLEWVGSAKAQKVQDLSKLFSSHEFATKEREKGYDPLWEALVEEASYRTDWVLYWCSSQSLPRQLIGSSLRCCVCPLEQVISRAAGSALAGDFPLVVVDSLHLCQMIPWVLEQMDYQGVLLVLGSGFEGGEGVQVHPYALSDFRWLRTIPHIVLAAAMDNLDCLDYCRLAYDEHLPLALRIPSRRCQTYSLKGRELLLGKHRSLRSENHGQAIVATLGSTVLPCLLAAESLAVHGVELEVIDVGFVRPFDLEIFEKTLATSTQTLFCVEEHFEQGGLATEMSDQLRLGRYEKLRLFSLGVAEKASSLQKSSSLEEIGLSTDAIAHFILENLRSVYEESLPS